jgi:hypothetical protein
MSDVVVTLPKSFRWDGAPGKPALEAWLAEGDAPGEPDTGSEYGFTVGGGSPRIEPGERVYVVHHARLIGYAPLVRVQALFGGRVELVRAGGAAAVTIDTPIPGFRGWRYRWWRREDERPFDLRAFAESLRAKEPAR